jgi:hypothetical protein
MRRKEIVDRVRLRRVPEGFGWVDHRLVRDGHVKGRSAGSLALYLFLVTVSDGDGVSYYSDESLCGHLGFGGEALRGFRRELVECGLVAWRRPFYQVLALREPGRRDAASAPDVRDSGGGPAAIGDVMDRIVGGRGND